MRSRALLPIVAMLALSGCESLTELEQRQPLAATLSGSAVRPGAVQTTGHGTLVATLFSLRGEAIMDYELEFTGLVGAPDAVHLHGPADSSGTAGVLVDLALLPEGSAGTIALGATFGSASGSLDLRLPVTRTVSGDSLHVLLDAGLVYVDVHTTAHPDGEIRGQLRKR